MSEFGDRFVALELVKVKLAPKFASKSKKIFGYLRGKYETSRLYGNEYKSKSQRIRERIVLTVPYDLALEGIFLHIHEEIPLGFGYVTMETLASCLHNSLDIIEMYLLHETTNEKIGKVYFNIYSDEKRANPFISAGLNKENNEPTKVQAFYDRETTSLNHDTTILKPPNDFKFHKLNKQIYWDRIKTMNINKITQNNDIATLFECIEDVSKGDISGKINDENAAATVNSVQLAQYSTQYLLKCYSMLQEREALLKSAYKAFIDEDVVLDEKLAKYAARKKALSRENKFLNDLYDKNLSILSALDPKVSEKYIHSADVQPTSTQVYDEDMSSHDLSHHHTVVEGRVSSPSSRKSSPPKAFVKSIMTDQDFTEAITSAVISSISPSHDISRDSPKKSSAHSSPSKADNIPVVVTSKPQASSDWKSAVQSNSIPVTNSVQTFTSDDLNTSYDSVASYHHTINEQVLAPKVVDTEYHILSSIKSHAKDNFVSVNTLSTGIMSLDSLNINNNQTNSLNMENSLDLGTLPATQEEESVMLEDLDDLEDINLVKNVSVTARANPSVQPVEVRKVVNNRYHHQDDDIFNHHSVNTSHHEDDVMGFDLSASLDTSVDNIMRPDGLRTGVINYINRGKEDGGLSMTGPGDNVDSSNDDVLIGTNKPKSFGNTGSSYTFSDLSATSSVENMEDKLARDIQNNNKAYASVDGQLEWLMGRSPLDNIEVGQALDVLVSGVRLERDSVDLYSNIFIKIEFMSAVSGSSNVIKTSNKNSIQPVNFASHILFDRQTSMLLSDEIDSAGEDLCLYINVYDADNNRICGQASVFLYSMIESSTSLLRQEIEIVAIDDNDNNIGTIIVDIRGYQLLKRCG